MKILQVSYYDNLGGAARIAWLLHQRLRAQGHDAWMASSKKKSNDPFVYRIPVVLPRWFFGKFFFRLAEYAEARNWISGYRNLAGVFYRLADPARYWKRYKGKEDFDFPGSRTITKLLPEVPEVIHLHNLHLNYFDLSYLPELTRNFPTVMTFHDMWAITGHCAHSMQCEKWKTGCGECPQLKIYPAMQTDQTAFNWKRKQEIYSRSRLYVTAPSNWMMRIAERSMFAPAILKTKVIPNGVDLSIYYPKDKQLIRGLLALPLDATILLFISAGGMNTNSYKDFHTIRAAIEIVARKFNQRKVIFIAMGGETAVERVGDIEVRYIPHQSSSETVANYYRAADIYLHAARAESFGIVIAEAQACGTPVIATAIGGIPETILDGRTGFLTQPGNPTHMSEKIIQLLEDEPLCDAMRAAAGIHAREHFGLDRMVDSYVSFYQEILNAEK